MSKYDIYISFSQEDIAVAERVVEVLNAYKRLYEFEYFCDKGAVTIAADYLQRISDAISESRTLLFIASQSAYDSAFCGKELLFAQSCNAKIYRYCTDGATPPKNLELLLIDQPCIKADDYSIEEMVREVLSSVLGSDVGPLTKSTVKANPQTNVSPTPTPTPTPDPKADAKPSFMRKLGAKAGWALLSALVPIILGVCSKKFFDREFDDIIKGYVGQIFEGDTSVHDLLEEPNRKYRVGDFVTVGGVQGVVFQTKPQVKVVSAAESVVAWGADITSGAADVKYGKANLAAVQRTRGWQSRYPAFKWCADMGDGWYLPSIEELGAIYENKDKIDKALQKHECKTLGAESPHCCLWSSSESSSYEASSLIFTNGADYIDNKTENNAARAVFALGEMVVTTEGPSAEKRVVVYNIGDLVTIAGVQGVVYQTSPQVKVISVRHTECVWSKRSTRVGTADEDNGKANMAVVKRLQNWQSDYPAFKWCAELGEGWYLPAINELDAIYHQREIIDKVLKDNGYKSFISNNMCFWSSTEFSSYNAFDIHPSFGTFSDFNKGNQNIVHAVCVLATN